jgi:hypothetical protein
MDHERKGEQQVKVSELKELLAKIPEDAIVYVSSDSAQTAEFSGGISVTAETELSFYGDEITWYDEDEAVELKHATAVVIR